MAEWRVRSIYYEDGNEVHFVETRTPHQNDVHSTVWKGVGGGHLRYADAVAYAKRHKVVKVKYTEL